MLVTLDGELLGSSNLYPPTKDPDSLGTLLADIAVDYKRLGEQYAAVTDNHAPPPQQQQPQQTIQQQQPPRAPNPYQPQQHHHLDCLLIYLEGGLAAATACDSIDCFVLAIAQPDTPPGLLKARLSSLADHVQESMSLLMEAH